jgi:starch synthase (maltosyl-transferring)
LVQDTNHSSRAEPQELRAGRRRADRVLRVVIEGIWPQIDGGAYPIKRTVGQQVVVEADLLADGHDRLAGALLYRPRDGSGSPWREEPLTPIGAEDNVAGASAAHAAPGSALAPAATAPPAAKPIPTPPVNDRWRASFVVDALGTWEYTITAWVDAWATWCWGVERKVAAGQSVAVELRVAAALAAAAAAGAAEPDSRTLRMLAARLGEPGDEAERIRVALAPEAARLMRAHPDRTAATTYDPALEVLVEPTRAGFSSWYEMFPRSCGPAGKHGTLRDAERRLPYVASMGFDVLYLPPIHPIGRTFRKGKDNELRATPSDPGSPWAIGDQTGGHLAVHPELGTLEDLRHFVAAAREHGLEVALDIALQTSPDHPYVREHPEWFAHRPDGSIQYAENPPKKYQDIYPLDFAGDAWSPLWDEVRRIFLHWIAQGVRIFRVDNPHTKPLRFWRWCLTSIRQGHPDVVFLAEAFTRPKLMNALAKAGFSQSYTYFTWRTTKHELVTYVTSLLDPVTGEFFRPNFWPTTPDILPQHLQYGTRATFIARAVLAATLSPNWGIYGPAYELQEHVARDGAEEYAHNEKYELRSWDLDRADSLRPVLRRLNQIRRDNPALQRLAGTVFHAIDNDLLVCYSRVDADHLDLLLIVVNLDPHHRQSGWLQLDLAALGLDHDTSFQVHDLMSDARYLWQGARAFVELDPNLMPAHVFRVRRRVHTERTFEYYL